jgi:hypothetical protein
MIDRATGDLIIDAAERIGPATTHDAFAASMLARGAKGGSRGGMARRIVTRTIGDRTFTLILQFNDQKLVAVRLSDNVPESTSWDDASEEKELERKRRHDEWLEGELGLPPYEYAWGRVTSLYQPKTGESVIVIQYD